MTSQLTRNLLVLTASLAALIVASCGPPPVKSAPAAVSVSSPEAAAAAQDAEKTAQADAASLVAADQAAAPLPAEPAPVAKP